MPKITLNTDRCKGCGLCVAACNKEVLELSKNERNAKGYAVVSVKAQDNCIGCGACYAMCPDCVITVER